MHVSATPGSAPRRPNCGDRGREFVARHAPYGRFGLRQPGPPFTGAPRDRALGPGSGGKRPGELGDAARGDPVRGLVRLVDQGRNRAVVGQGRPGERMDAPFAGVLGKQAEELAGQADVAPARGDRDGGFRGRTGRRQSRPQTRPAGACARSAPADRSRACDARTSGHPGRALAQSPAAGALLQLARRPELLTEEPRWAGSQDAESSTDPLRICSAKVSRDPAAWPARAA